MAGESPTSGIRMHTLIWALTTLVVPVRAESGDFQCAVRKNCDDTTTVALCGIPGSGFLHLSVEMRCPNRVVRCLYNASGDCKTQCTTDCPNDGCHYDVLSENCKNCTTDCPNVTNDGNLLEVVTQLSDGTCTLTISPINESGINTTSWAVEVINDCKTTSAPHNVTVGSPPDERGHASDTAMDALPMHLLHALLITTLCTLITVDY